MNWTEHIPKDKMLDCKPVAAEVYGQVDTLFGQLENHGVKPSQIRVQALLAHNPDAAPDAGSLRYAKFMGRKFREKGIDYRLDYATTANALKTMAIGARENPKVNGIFIYFPTPFDKSEDYFLSNISPEKDIEGLTAGNYGRMALNVRSFDQEEEYDGVVPCTAKAVLTLLHHYEPIRNMFPKNGAEGPFATIVNSSSRIGIPLQRMLTSIGVTTVACNKQTKRSDLEYFLDRADLVVTAYPCKSDEQLIRRVKKDAVVIDCSHEGNLHPDIVDQASYISTHDNHLGQITTALALYNTALCVRWQKKLNGRH